MENYKETEANELTKSIEGQIITINLFAAESSYFNPLKIEGPKHKVDVQKRIDESIIPWMNSVALLDGFTLSELEKNKIKEIIAEGYKNQTNYNILQLRDELIRKYNNTEDVSRVIALLNQILRISRYKGME